MDFKKILRGPVIWIVAALLIVFAGVSMLSGGGYRQVDTNVGLQLIKDGRVSSAKIVDGDQRVDLVLKSDYQDQGRNVQFYYVEPRGQQVVDAIDSANPPKGYTDEVAHTPWYLSLLINFVPFLLIGLVFWFFIMNSQGGSRGAMQFGKSRAKLASKDTPKVTFKDVAGIDEAVEELQEIKEFLSEPAKFKAVGARIPKGVLLYGPPGTGKTLLAKAVAGEAGVPFYSISGSDFVEMFVGVGASRVRDLFEQAKQHSPAIVFIDEIDAVGRQRGAGLGGGHDEREQTLNQLLVEMDGFDANTNVILIAATNRPDVLDPALLRPGRFDRQVAVDAPDMAGRQKILEVHAQGKPLAPGTDLANVARRTPGFTGADLANVLNEAALLTARSDAQLIDNRALDEAIDRVVAGPQRRTRLMNEKEKKLTAYHEGGHALVATAMRYSDPVNKITILPRGRALGYTMVLPTEDKYSTTRNELLDQLAYAMGGRVAEELVFHDPTTGASNDIDKATSMARKMVTEYGMSSRVGAIKLGSDSTEPFLGRDMGHARDYSEEVAGIIDEEVRAFVEHAHDEAWEVLTQYRDVLDRLVLELLDKETLNQEQLKDVFAPVVKRPVRPVWLSSSERPVSDRPPVLTPEELEDRHNGAAVAPQDQAAEAGGGIGSSSTPLTKPGSSRPPASGSTGGTGAVSDTDE